MGVSLPEHRDGAIFIIERSSTTGDMYVDIEQGKRLHIVPDSPIKYVSKSWAQSHTSVQPAAGDIYVISDFEQNAPGIKIGDGSTYLVDLPVFYTVTQEKKDFWDNKVSVIEPTSSEILTFTTN